MNRRYLHWALKLHPRAWRERYGEEVFDLSEEFLGAHEMSKLRLALGLLGSALLEQFRTLLRMGRLAMLSVCVAVLVGLGAFALVTNLFGPDGMSPGTSLTAGTIPPRSQNGSVDLTKVPDFIATVGRNGKLVGYIPRAYVFPSNFVNSPVSSKLGGVAPVYARNLKTLIGHLYPGVGFVPLGSSPTSEPCLPAWTTGVSTSGAVTQPIACPSTTEIVPSVVGMYTPTGGAALSSQSLFTKIAYAHSGSVPAGYVISITPSAGTKVPARSQVKIVSSLGASTG